jgi:flagellar hook-length control protein FliK
MNIESTNLLSSVSSSGGTTETVSQPLADGSVVADGFSGALIAQIGLLNNIKAGGVVPSQTPNPAGVQNAGSSQDAAGVPTGAIELQDVAALVGNNLPVAYKIKSDADHEATLAAVNDTLKYIETSAGTVGTVIGSEPQNINNAIAMTIPVKQSVADAAVVAIPAKQSVADAAVVTIPVKQDVKDSVLVPVGIPQSQRNAQNEDVTAEQSAGQNQRDAQNEIVAAEQNTKNIVIDAPAQTVTEQVNSKPDKKVEGEAQTASAGDGSGIAGLLMSMIFPAAVPTDQPKTVNNLAPAPTDATKDGATLSFIGGEVGNIKSSPLTKNSGDMLQGEAAFRQSSQDKQDFSLKYFDDYSHTEKTGRIEPQALNVEGGKVVSGAGGAADVAQVNRPVVDNKTDVPAITKPLSHPEWNKDLGDRIVWMSNKAIPTAEIRLNPQHLGPISVRVNVTDDQATVVFTAQHAAVRETLEASIPKLREMMSAQNLNLADVNVTQSSAPDQGRSQSQNFAQNFADGRQQGAAGAAVEGVDEVEQEIESGRAVVSKGVLSIYA